MCRHAAYVGPARTLASFVLEPPHSLLRQSYAARELNTGVVAADGFGAAWYGEGAGSHPAVYRSVLPIWADASFASVARWTSSGLIVASVRNATVAGTTAHANVHPFQAGGLVLAHNGYQQAWRSRFRRAMCARLSDDAFGRLEGSTESEVFMHLVADRIAAGQDLVDAVRDETKVWLDAGASADVEAQWNVLASDGSCVVATRAGVGGAQNSLYLRSTTLSGGEGGLLHEVASEPLDDHSDWSVVPESQVVVLRAQGPARMMPI